MTTAYGRYTQALANQYRVASGNKPRGGVDYSVLTGDTSAAVPSAKASKENPQGVRKIIDILSQPLYSVVETAKDTAADVYKGFHADNGVEGTAGILGSALKFAPRLLGNLGSDNDKKMWSDVLRGDKDFVNSFNEEAGIDQRITKDNGILANREGQGWGETAAKFLLGTAADVGGDPSSYVGPGLIKAAVKLPVQLAEKTVIGAKAIEAVKSSTLGGDAQRVGRKLFGVKAGDAKAEHEMADIAAAKVDAQAAESGPLQIEAARRIPESHQIDAYPEAPFEAAPRIGTEQTDGVFQAGRPDLGAEGAPGQGFTAPAGMSRAPSVVDDVPTPMSTQQQMLYDTLTGEVKPPTAALRRQMVGKESLYSDDQIAQAQKLWKKPTPEQQAEAHAKELIATRAANQAEVSPSVAPVVEAAESTSLRPAIPEGVNPQQFTEDVGAARAAAVEPVTFNDYVRQSAAGGSIDAKRFIDFSTKKARGVKLNPIQEAALKGLGRRLTEGHSKAVSASQSLAKRAPALVKRKPPVEAAAARTEAATAAQTVRVKRAATASARRLKGAALQSWVNKSLNSGLQPEHLIKLRMARSEKEFNRTIAGMRRTQTKGTPRHTEFAINVHRAGNEIEAPATMSEKAVAEVAESPVAQGFTEAESVDQILARSNPHPDPDALARIGAGENLRPEIKDRVIKVLEEQGWRQGSENLPHTTNTGTRTTTPVEAAGTGQARNVTYNAPAQMKVFQEVVNSHLDEMAAIRTAEKAKTRSQTGVGTKWKIRAGEQIYDLIIKDLKDIDDFMFANKVYGTATAGKEGVPLYLSQAFEALHASEAGRNLLYGRILDSFGFQISRVPGAKSGSFLSAKMKDRSGTADVDSLLKLMGKIAKIAESPDAAGIARFNAQFDGFIDEFEKTLKGYHVGSLGETTRGITKGGPAGTRQAVTGPEAAYVLGDAERALKDPDTLAHLFQGIRENAAKAEIRFGDEASAVAENTVRHVLNTLDNAVGRATDAERVESLLHPENYARTLTSSDDVAEVAAEAARAKIGEVVPEIDVVNAKASETAFKHGDEAATSKTHVNNKNKANATKHDENYKASAAETPPEVTVIPEEQTDLAMQTAIGKMVDTFLNRFVAHYGNATVHEAMVAMGSVGSVMSRAYAKELTALDAAVKKAAVARGGITHKELASEAWEILAKGKSLDEVGPEMTPLVEQMQHLTDVMFATSRGDGKPQSVLSLWQREGFDLEAINAKLGQNRFGLPEDARLKFTVKGADGKNRAVTDQELADQWRSWPVKDPVDFLHRMERVTTELATEASISRDFYRIAANKGLASIKSRPGFVGVTRAEFGSESILNYLPKNAAGITYIHKDLVPEVKRMDALLRGASGGNSELTHFIKNNVDPILAMWKSGMTIWRPGHHWRNIVGDTIMAYIKSGVKNPVYYARAIKMVTSKQNALGRQLRGSYGTWDALAAMQGLHRAAEGGAFNKELGDEIIRLGQKGDGPAGTVARAQINGKPYDVDDTELFAALMDRGALPDFRRQEDIIDVGDTSTAITDRIANKTGWAGSGGQKVLKSAHNKLASFSEGRDDFVRIGHALGLIEKGIDGKKTWKTVEEMYDQVAARIRQTHPDGSDLTPFEKNVMRRTLPFYSWTRKAIPLIAEGVLTRPGRITQYPKAMYNLAQSAGVDLESMSNPFPEDQAFPKFITDKMTGIGWESADGHYWSFDIGAPQADIMNQFVGGGSPGDIANGILGLLNPAIKVPAEIATGHQAGNQIPISDTSDYVDSYIPGLNSISSIFGISPSSGVENALHGKLGFDSTRQVERGNRSGVFENPEYLLNFLLGQRFTDTTKPNYIKMAQLQNLAKQGQGGG